jgi:hypothetical protein
LEELGLCQRIQLLFAVLPIAIGIRFIEQIILLIPAAVIEGCYSPDIDMKPLTHASSSTDL